MMMIFLNLVALGLVGLWGLYLVYKKCKADWDKWVKETQDQHQ